MKVRDLKPGRFFLYRGRLCMLFSQKDFFTVNHSLLGIVVFDLADHRDDAGRLFLIDEDRDVKYFENIGYEENTSNIKLYLLKCSRINEGLEEDYPSLADVESY